MTVPASNPHPPAAPQELLAAPENPPLRGWKSSAASRTPSRSPRSSRPQEDQPALPGMENALSPASIAAKVAKRYARLPSYREMLAATASSTVDSIVEAAGAAAPAGENPPQPREPRPQPIQQDLLRYSVSADSLPAAPVAPVQAFVEPHPAPPAEILDPLEEATVEPAHPLPGRIIEAPRELVAPRKARPRRAEGPLLDDAPHASAPEPLSSRESAPIRVSEPAAPASDTAPARSRASVPSRSQWLSIQLDNETPARQQGSSFSAVEQPTLHVASFEDRAMAALVDLGLVAASFLLFVTVFAFSTTHFPTGRIALAGACAIFLVMGLLYQFLFFTLTDATPGMRYSRIALCTFDDENPTRPALRARIAALLLSALPLGLGFLWAVFDEDALGWHDRITRTYQRSYRDL